MIRRALLQGLVGVTAGLLLPPTLDENTEAAKRYWALDRTMVTGRYWESGWLDAGMTRMEKLNYDAWFSVVMSGEATMASPYGDIHVAIGQRGELVITTGKRT